MKVYRITEQNLLEWFYKGEEGLQLKKDLAEQVIQHLALWGTFKISVRGIFKELHDEGIINSINLKYLEEFSYDNDRELDDLDHEWKLKLIKKN